MSYTRYMTVNFGASRSALTTVGYQLFDSNNDASGDRITADIHNLGGGSYGALVTIPDHFAGRIKWDDTATSLTASEEINDVALPTAPSGYGATISTQDVRNAMGLAYTGTSNAASGSVDKTLTDILTATNTIGGGKIVHRGPVASDGHITIVRGDDYNVASGQPLEWTDTGGLWPTLTGASISFTARIKQANGTIGSVALTTTGTVVTGSGTNKKVRVEPLKASTASLAAGNRNHRFDVQATLATGEVVTLVMGDMTVIEDITS